jgi:uncharacterized membrane protein YqaE (UPF0057 family)
MPDSKRAGAIKRNASEMENHMAVTGTDPIKIIFAILLPPVGVFMEVGLSGHFWLNILLTILGYVPGIIHALYVILKH